MTFGFQQVPMMPGADLRGALCDAANRRVGQPASFLQGRGSLASLGSLEADVLLGGCSF